MAALSMVTEITAYTFTLFHITYAFHKSIDENELFSKYMCMLLIGILTCDLSGESLLLMYPTKQFTSRIAQDKAETCL